MSWLAFILGIIALFAVEDWIKRVIAHREKMAHVEANNVALGYLIDAVKYHLALRDDDAAKRSLEHARSTFIDGIEK